LLRIDVPVDFVSGPFLIHVAQRPGFHQSELGIRPPVHHQAQFLVFEPLQALQQQRVLRFHPMLFTAVIVDAFHDDGLLFFLDLLDFAHLTPSIDSID
ncbi:hypothetical protein BGX30_005282, partial [Mortierella sp. GBA39]